MRVLISGGKKTINIVKSLENRFASGSVELTIEENIDNIESFLSRGDYFDRAIIIEQSWTKDGAQQDEIVLRRSINNFISIIKQKHNRDFSLIFIATTEKMAKIAWEETIDIQESSCVILKAPPYSVGFFASLVTKEMNDIPEYLIFKLNDLQESEPTNSDYYSFGERLDPVTDIGENTLNNNMEQDIEFKSIDTNNEENASLDDEIFGNVDITDDFDSTTFDNEVENIFDNGYDTIESDDFFEQIDEDGIDFFEKADIGDNEFTEEMNMSNDNFSESIDIDDTTSYDEVDIDDTSFTNKINIKEGNFYKETNTEDIDSCNKIEDNFITDATNEKETEIQELLGFNNLTEHQENIEKHTNTKEPNKGLIEQVKSDRDIQQLFDTTIFNKDKERDVKNTKLLVDIPSLETQKQLYEDNKQGKKSFSKQGNKKVGRSTIVPDVNMPQLKSILDALSVKGTSIVVTGASGSGVSTIAANLANTLVKLGYAVLLVDMDTKNRAQAYMSKDAYEIVHSNGIDNASLRLALNNPHLGVGRYVNIISPAFHVLTMGLAGDIIEDDKLAEKSKLIRFSNIAKSSYQFIIYDIPFDKAVSYCSDIVCSADNIIMTVDSSNWGVMKALLAMSNIDDAAMQKAMFTRAQICFTKYIPKDKIIGYKAKSLLDILTNMDKLIEDLLGDCAEYRFEDMQICGVAMYDDLYDKCWFSQNYYSDYEVGYITMIKLINNMYINK